MKTFSKHPGRNEQTDTVACDLCGGTERSPLYKTGGVVFHRCLGCGLVFQNPQPRQEDLLKRYDGEYYQYELENERQFFGLMLLALGDVNFPFNSHGGGKSFLDIGCATGLLLEHLRGKYGWDTRGVEVCGAAARHGIRERGLSIFHGTLDQAAFPGESFDVVHASHVIEHVNSPAAFLAEAGRVLKPGGTIIITTPNIAGLQSKLFREKWRSAIADHLYLLSAGTLKRYFQKQGLTLVQKKTWGGIAKGAASGFGKKLLDKSAKLFGFGDVMVFRGRKETVL